jgi:hypothetical protein
MKISFLFAWYDLWIGFFWDSKKKWLYFLPVPMFGIIFKFSPKQKSRRWNWSSFLFVMVLCGLGLATNKSVDSLTEWAFGTAVIGIPVSLLFAYIGRED